MTLEEAARKAIEQLDLSPAFAPNVLAHLASAARGTVALHVVKEHGYWTVERWSDGEMVESYVGASTVAEALDRIGDWMRINTERTE